MPCSRLLRFVLLLPLTVPAFSLAADQSPAPGHSGDAGKNDAELERMMAGPKYDFTFVDAKTLLDPSGAKLAVRDVKKHLKKGKYDRKAAIVLWFEPDAKLPESGQMADLIMAFQSYGMTNFVVRRKPGKTVVGADGTRTLFVDTQTNPNSLTSKDPLPAFAGRPAELRPGALPPRVRYRTATDEAVIAAAATIRQRLLDAAPGDGRLFDDIALVNAGAWQYFRNDANIGHKNSKPVTGRIPFGKKVVQLDGRLLQDPAEVTALELKLRNLIQEDGGGTVRAMRSGEMDKWWTFIGFDIEEPVFVVESKGGRYLFVITFTKDGAFQLDELNGLPGH